MANPQLENGYIRIATELMDALMKIRINGEARQMFDAILRKTYGFNKKEDQISAGQFTELTGLTKRAIQRAREKLLKMNLIGITNNGYTKCLTYSINKNYKSWRGEPKKVTVTQIDRGCNPKRLRKVTQKASHNRQTDNIQKTEHVRAGAHDLSACEPILKHKQERIYIEEKELFEFWNDLKIIVHKDIKPFIPHLSSKLKTYKMTEISQSMENYALVLQGNQYYWSYKWDLKKFLTQANAMDRFTPENFKEWDFLNKEEKERGKKKDEQHDRFKRKNNQEAFKGNHRDWETE